MPSHINVSQTVRNSEIKLRVKPNLLVGEGSQVVEVIVGRTYKLISTGTGLVNLTGAVTLTLNAGVNTFVVVGGTLTLTVVGSLTLETLVEI